MSWQMMGATGWGMVSATVLLVGLVALVAAIIVWQMLGNTQPTSSADDAAKDMLKRRLAQGEISTEDYEKLLLQIDVS